MPPHLDCDVFVPASLRSHLYLCAPVTSTQPGPVTWVAVTSRDVISFSVLILDQLWILHLLPLIWSLIIQHMLLPPYVDNFVEYKIFLRLACFKWNVRRVSWRTVVMTFSRSNSGYFYSSSYFTSLRLNGRTWRQSRGSVDLEDLLIIKSFRCDTLRLRSSRFRFVFVTWLIRYCNVRVQSLCVFRMKAIVEIL